MSSKTSLLVCILLILQHLFAFSCAQICGTDGNFTSGSIYQDNLITLLSTLSTYVDSSGFYNASVGISPNRVSAIVMCGADLQLDLCKFCVQNSTMELLGTCPNQRQAIWWNPLCMIRYSDVPIFGTFALLPGRNERSFLNATSPKKFLTDLSTLLGSLKSNASNSLHKVAAGSIDSADLQTIYALLQCTPDISSTDCNACLNDAIREMVGCCSISIFAEIYLPSCKIITDNRPFVNETRMQELEHAPPMQTPPLLLPPLRAPPLAVSPGPLPFAPLPMSSSSGNGNDVTARLIMTIVLFACLLRA